MPKKKMIYLFIALILVGLLYMLWENTHFVITPYDFSHEKLPAQMDGLRILQISDLHNQSFGKDNKKLLAAVEKLQADVIVVTGDLIDSTFTNTEKGLAFAKELVKLAPVYYCTGNHEHRLPKKDLKIFLQDLSNLGVRVLCDEAIPFYGGTLVGLDEPSSHVNTLEGIMASVEDPGFTLLLSHKPHYIENYLDADLVLAGHAHGGQVYIPFVGGLIAPGQGYFPKYTKGFYTMEKTTMLISRGIGDSHRIPRIFNIPELVLLTLHAQ